MPVPPKIVRRLVLAPLVALLDAAVVLVSPVLLVLALIASPVTGGLRPLRALAIVVVFAARHLAALIAAFGLWIASGFGQTTG